MVDYTNLYYGEHFQTDDNRITLRRLPDEQYDVAWTCKSDDIDYYDARARDNPIAIHCTARVMWFRLLSARPS